MTVSSFQRIRVPDVTSHEADEAAHDGTYVRQPASPADGDRMVYRGGVWQAQELAPILIPAGAMHSDTGTAATLGTAAKTHGWLVSDSATSGVDYTMWALDSAYDGVDAAVDVIWSREGGSAGAIVWRLDHFDMVLDGLGAQGTNGTVTSEAQVTTDASASVVSVPYAARLGVVTLDSDNGKFLRVLRIGGDAADTATTIRILAIVVTPL